MMVYFGFYNFYKLLQLTRVLLSGLDNRGDILSPGPGRGGIVEGVCCIESCAVVLRKSFQGSTHCLEK